MSSASSPSASTNKTAGTVSKLRDELTQCQGCWKRKGEEGMTLKRCNRCKTAVYCSPECQRAAWPNHKYQCNLSVKTAQKFEGNDKMLRLSEDLAKWTSKHRPTLAQSVIDCLNIQNRPKAHETDVMALIITYQPNSPNVQTRFRVDNAEAVPYEVLLRQIQYEGLTSMPEQRRMMEIDQKRQGMAGMAMCLLTCIENGSGIFRVVPVGFAADALEAPRNRNWELRLKQKTLMGIIY